MFGQMTTPALAIAEVLRLKSDGLTDRAVSARTGVPVATIRGWRRRGVPEARKTLVSERCAPCGGGPQRWTQLPQDTYAYLLGVYLGDGQLRCWGEGWTLRITLDVVYPRILPSARPRSSACAERLRACGRITAARDA